MNRFCILLSICALTLPAAAADLYLSTNLNTGNQLAGLTFLDGDIVLTNPAGSTASIFAAEATFGSNPDIDAFHVLPNGNWLVSALFNDLDFNGATSFLDGDVAEYNPNTNQATLFFSESLLSGTSPDIDGVTVNSAGHMVFSTLSDSSLAGLNFTDGDIVEWNANTNTAQILVAEADIFDDGDGDIYGLHWLPNNQYLLTPNTTELISGISFEDGDVVLYDPATDSASLFFAETSFGVGTDVDALYYVPEPASLALFALALVIRRR